MSSNAKFYLICVALLATALACGSAQTRLTDAEERVGTANKGDWLLHRIPEEPYGLGLFVPGYILGFEKASREKKFGLCKPATKGDRGWADAGVRRPTRVDGLEGVPKEKREELLERRNDNVAGWLSDGQHAFLTHIVRYEYRADIGQGAIWPDLIYNAYTEEWPCRAGERCRELHTKGLGLLEGREPLPQRSETLSEAVARDAKAATHILVYAMGWNTDQQESLRNFNSLIGTLLKAAGTGSGFKPLVIGITWDSLAGKGLVRPFTYPFKANDADEIGTVWVSRVLWDVLAPLKRRVNPPKIVVIGHSFGARALTQGMYSKPYLPTAGGESKEVVDLALMLQGAFSVNRFLPHHGREGAPYAARGTAARKIALTWSIDDKANPKALYFSRAKMAGGKPGFDRAAENPAVFELRRWGEGGWVGSGPEVGLGERGPDKVLMIDASQVVRYETHRKGGKAHSDIYHDDVARLTWDLIRKFAPVGGEPREK